LLRLPSRTILIGDVLDKMKEIPSESVDCAVSSPPYWNLRDYGVEGQWGLEPDFKDYLKKMQKFMAELQRICKKTATCWINLGDTYAGGNGGSKWDGVTDDFVSTAMQEGKFKGPLKNHVKPKSRYGIPERFYIDSIDAGWVARNHIPWIKPNPMPSSVPDRLTNVWESIFFFSKNSEPVYWHNDTTMGFSDIQPLGINGVENIDWEYVPCRKCNETGKTDGAECKRCKGLGKRRKSLWKSEDYYFNLNAIREEHLTQTKKLFRKVAAPKGEQAKLIDLPDESKTTKDSIQDAQTNVSRLHRNRDGNKNKQDSTMGADGKPKPTYAGFNDRYKARQGEPSQYNNIKTNLALARANGGEHDSALNHPLGKNPGDIFVINAKPFLEAHFATFPLDLPLKILKCSCPKDVCSDCGAPRFPIFKPSEEYAKYLGKAWHDHNDDLRMGQKQKKDMPSVTADYRIVGWTECNCKAKFVPGMVFDPFFGAGTTAVAAEMLGLDWIGTELKQEYVSKIVLNRLDSYRNMRMRDFV